MKVLHAARLAPSSTLVRELRLQRWRRRSVAALVAAALAAGSVMPAARVAEPGGWDGGVGSSSPSSQESNSGAARVVAERAADAAGPSYSASDRRLVGHVRHGLRRLGRLGRFELAVVAGVQRRRVDLVADRGRGCGSLVVVVQRRLRRQRVGRLDRLELALVAGIDDGGSISSPTEAADAAPSTSSSPATTPATADGTARSGRARRPRRRSPRLVRRRQRAAMTRLRPRRRWATSPRRRATRTTADDGRDHGTGRGRAGGGHLDAGDDRRWATSPRRERHHHGRRGRERRLRRPSPTAPRRPNDRRCRAGRSGRRCRAGRSDRQAAPAEATDNAAPADDYRRPR